MFKNFKLKKAVLAGITYYMPTFIIGMIPFAMGLDKITISWVWWIASIIFMFVSMKYVYKSKSGLETGIIFLLTTLIIEIPLVVYGFKQGWDLFAQWNIQVQYALTIITPLIAVKWIK